MSKIASLAAVAGVAVAIFSATASATVVTFESQAAFRCDSSSQTDGGLNFAHSFYACFYSPTQPADFPTSPASTVMAIGFSDIALTKVGGGIFSLETIDLAFGPYAHGNPTSDTTLVTGFLQGGGSTSSLLTVDSTFDTYVLNWSNLTSVVFSQLQHNSGYLAFDNVSYDSNRIDGRVPEPGSLALLAAGLIGAAALRRR